MDHYTGFLLSYLKYGDHDAVVHCFTQEAGYQSFFIKGIYASKNKKKAFLSPMNELSITVSSHHKPTSTGLHKASQVNGLEARQDFYDVKYNTISFFVSEFLNQILNHEEANAYLYQEIIDLKKSLDENNYQAHYLFLIRILEILGIAPLLTEDVFLNVEKGVFQSDQNIETIDPELSLIWKKVLIRDRENWSESLKNISKKQLLDSILKYYQCHFPEFRVPRSLEIIYAIFE